MCGRLWAAQGQDSGKARTGPLGPNDSLRGAEGRSGGGRIQLRSAEAANISSVETEFG